LSTGISRISKAKQIEYRRNSVAEMLVEGKTHQEMAEALNISRQTIDLDVAYLEHKAREETRLIIDKKLPLSHVNAIKGIDKVIHWCWKIINETEDDRVRLSYLALVSDSYKIRDDFMTDAKTINSVIDGYETIIIIIITKATTTITAASTTTIMTIKDLSRIMKSESEELEPEYIVRSGKVYVHVDDRDNDLIHHFYAAIDPNDRFGYPQAHVYLLNGQAYILRDMLHDKTEFRPDICPTCYNFSLR
jgi:hypothetical protein